MCRYFLFYIHNLKQQGSSSSSLLLKEFYLLTAQINCFVCQQCVWGTFKQTVCRLSVRVSHTQKNKKQETKTKTKTPPLFFPYFAIIPAFWLPVSNCLESHTRYFPAHSILACSQDAGLLLPASPLTSLPQLLPASQEKHCPPGPSLLCLRFSALFLSPAWHAGLINLTK